MSPRNPTDLGSLPACPRCGMPGAKDITHVCMFAGLPYEHQPRTVSPTMRHTFSGDPWGPCSGCGHPAYHEIHRVEIR